MNYYIAVWGAATWVLCTLLIDHLWPQRLSSVVFWTVGTLIISLLCALFVHAWGWEQYIVLSLVVLWAGRLCVYIYYRDTRKQTDNYHRNNVSAVDYIMLGFFMVCSSLPFVAMLPSGGLKAQYGMTPYIFTFSVMVWCIGFAVQSIAEYSLLQYKKQHPMGLLSRGLWSICRHPNYLGEMLMSVSLWGMSFGYISAMYSLYMFFLGPCFYGIAVVRYNIVNIELHMHKRRGYAAYKKATPCFFPVLRRRHTATPLISNSM